MSPFPPANTIPSSQIGPPSSLHWLLKRFIWSPQPHSIHIFLPPYYPPQMLCHEKESIMSPCCLEIFNAFPLFSGDGAISLTWRWISHGPAPATFPVSAYPSLPLNLNDPPLWPFPSGTRTLSSIFKPCVGLSFYLGFSLYFPPSLPIFLFKCHILGEALQDSIAWVRARN